MKKVSDNLMEHQIRGLITVLTTVQVGRPFANGVIGFVADSNWLLPRRIVPPLAHCYRDGVVQPFTHCPHCVVKPIAPISDGLQSAKRDELRKKDGKKKSAQPAPCP